MSKAKITKCPNCGKAKWLNTNKPDINDLTFYSRLINSQADDDAHMFLTWMDTCESCGNAVEFIYCIERNKTANAMLAELVSADIKVDK